MTAHGAFHWNELWCRDVQKVKTFYKETLGWTFDEMPMPDGTYYIAKSGDQPVGGLVAMSDPAASGSRESWFAYIAVDDIDARLAKAVARGAKVVRPAFDVPEVGRIAILEQPGGATIGWMTPAAR